MKRLSMIVWVIAACGASKSSPPSAGAPANGLPDPGTLAKVGFRQQQGFDRMRCNGTVYEIELDLAAGTWDAGTCVVVNAKDDDTAQPLARKHGKLTADMRKTFEDGYAKLAKRTGTCGEDGGTLTLTLTDRSGKATKFVDENWGCSKPEPAMLEGLTDLSRAMLTFVNFAP